MVEIMVNEFDDAKTFYNPGDVCTIRHDIPNKPIMWVVEKCTRSMFNKTTTEKENVFLGIKCKWFDLNQDLQEGLFSTKDLIKV
jgi:hypothetical protein